MKASTQNVILAVVLLMLMLGMVRLGVWQLGRADEKQAILDQTLATSNLPAVSLDDLDKVDEAQRFRQVRLRGQFVANATIYLDNQVFDTRVGYRVFTPMQISGSEWHILADRGWIAAGDDRRHLPAVNTQLSEQTVLGRLNLPAAKPPLWSSETPAVSGDVWQYLPIRQVASQLGLKLHPMVLELAPSELADSEPTLRRRWRTVDDKWVATHHGYAFQWFAMASALLLFCIVFLWRVMRPNLKRDTDYSD